MAEEANLTAEEAERLRLQAEPDTLNDRLAQAYTRPRLSVQLPEKVTDIGDYYSQFHGPITIPESLKTEKPVLTAPTTTQGDKFREGFEDFGTRAVDSAMLGFSDEAVGAIGALQGKNYTKERDKQRGRQAAADERSPVASLGGDIFGSVAVPIPGGTIAKELAGNVAQGVGSFEGPMNFRNLKSVLASSAVGTGVGRSVAKGVSKASGPVSVPNLSESRQTMPPLASGPGTVNLGRKPAVKRELAPPPGQYITDPNNKGYVVKRDLNVKRRLPDGPAPVTTPEELFAWGEAMRRRPQPKPLMQDIDEALKGTSPSPLPTDLPRPGSMLLTKNERVNPSVLALEPAQPAKQLTVGERLSEVTGQPLDVVAPYGRVAPAPQLSRVPTPYDIDPTNPVRGVVVQDIPPNANLDLPIETVYDPMMVGKMHKEYRSAGGRALGGGSDGPKPDLPPLPQTSKPQLEFRPEKGNLGLDAAGVDGLGVSVWRDGKKIGHVGMMRGDSELAASDLAEAPGMAGGQNATISHVEIDPKFRGQGVGSEIYRWAAEQANQKWGQRLHSGDLNPSSKAVWERAVKRGEARKTDQGYEYVLQPKPELPPPDTLKPVAPTEPAIGKKNLAKKTKTTARMVDMLKWYDAGQPEISALKGNTEPTQTALINRGLIAAPKGMGPFYVTEAGKRILGGK